MLNKKIVIVPFLIAASWKPLLCPLWDHWVNCYLLSNWVLLSHKLEWVLVLLPSGLIFKVFWRGSLSSIYMIISQRPNCASKEVVSGFLWLQVPQRRAAHITINRLCWLWEWGHSSVCSCWCWFYTSLSMCLTWCISKPVKTPLLLPWISKH